MTDNFAKDLEAVSDMGKLTLMVPNAERDYNISFHREGKTIGKLDFNGDEMKFIGEADESAEVFFDWLANAFKGRLEKERAAEREQCAKDYLEDCAKAVEAAKQECETCANKRKRLMDAGFLNSPLRGEDHVG